MPRTLRLANFVSRVALVMGLSGGSLAGQLAGGQSMAIEGQVVLPGGLKITEFGNENQGDGGSWSFSSFTW